MWIIAAQGSVDFDVAQEVVEFAKSKGFVARLTQSSPTFRTISITDYLVGRAGESLPNSQHSLAKKEASARYQGEALAQEGFATLDDLTKVSLEQFLTRVDCLSTQPLFQLMVQHKAAFTDADPAEFVGHEIKVEEVGNRVRNCLGREGITAWTMLPYIAETFVTDIRNFGDESLKKLKAELKVRGLRLKD